MRLTNRRVYGTSDMAGLRPSSLWQPFVLSPRAARCERTVKYPLRQEATAPDASAGGRSEARLRRRRHGSRAPARPCASQRCNPSIVGSFIDDCVAVDASSVELAASEFLRDLAQTRVILVDSGNTF